MIVKNPDGSTFEVPDPPSRSCMDEAYAIVGGERQDAYGKAEDSFQAVADVWNGLLRNKLRDGVRIAPGDVALLMCGLKLARETNQRKRDNVVDLHGYALLYGRLAGFGE